MSKPRYVPGRAWWPEGDDDPHSHYDATIPAITVDDPREPRFTGLYDADGRPLFRLPERMGFLPE